MRRNVLVRYRLQHFCNRLLPHVHQHVRVAGAPPHPRFSVPLQRHGRARRPHFQVQSTRVTALASGTRRHGCLTRRMGKQMQSRMPGTNCTERVVECV
eukprot:3109657-Rhodomonas_salina.7